MGAHDARLTPSVSFADRPSAFRLPVSRTAGGKLHALKEGALWQVIFHLGDKSKEFL